MIVAHSLTWYQSIRFRFSSRIARRNSVPSADESFRLLLTFSCCSWFTASLLLEIESAAAPSRCRLLLPRSIPVDSGRRRPIPAVAGEDLADLSADLSASSFRRPRPRLLPGRAGSLSTAVSVRSRGHLQPQAGPPSMASQVAVDLVAPGSCLVISPDNSCECV
jgi:hypothetical protein